MIPAAGLHHPSMLGEPVPERPGGCGREGVRPDPDDSWAAAGRAPLLPLLVEEVDAA